MNWKEFLKPDKYKIIIFILALISIIFYGYLTPDTHLFGYTKPIYDIGLPFVFFEYYPCTLALGVDCGVPWIDFNIINLILDIIIWYLISSLLAWCYHKYKK